MKLEKYKEEAQYFTGKLSDINRYLAFAGIAVIWIFKQEIQGDYNIPNELFIPLLLFIVSLVLDFFQYIYGATIWTLFFRYHEKKKSKESEYKDDIKAPKILSNISYVCFFYPKVISNFVGYIILIIYLSRLFFTSNPAG